jgi:hypothetical protein
MYPLTVSGYEVHPSVRPCLSVAVAFEVKLEIAKEHWGKDS